jgi:putative ABC transport system permease protein
VIVGAVVVYQILYTDVSSHLWEYATMKAIGYQDRQLNGVVLFQSILMSVLGFVPGCAIAQVIFEVTKRSIGLTIDLNVPRMVLVYVMTLSMCCIAGLLAMRALRKADPAEIF